jgi:hypothetical protein
MMDISIGEYGRMMFTIMTSNNVRDLPKHWASIRAEAEPLVRQLIVLNAKMTENSREGGYVLTGYTENGKFVLSNQERIDAARERLWGVKADILKIGDRVWPDTDELSIDPDMCYPATVEYIKGDHVFVIYDEDRISRIRKSETVIAAPADYGSDEEMEDRFGRDYWLARADELGI